jgi:hypothetical protein
MCVYLLAKSVVNLLPILVSNNDAVSRLGHAIALFIEMVNTVGLIGDSRKVQKSE